ncbi:MAG: 16S rRNA processing protein RimM [Firmicutes bacterium]|nr:16S rRNA processing protein RimM [Bacillota bacterium]
MEQTAAIGKVVTTFGVKGALKVMLLSDFPERIKMLKQVFVEKSGRAVRYNVQNAFIHGRFWVVHLEGVDSPEAAANLVGSLLTVPLSERVKLPPDTYYLDQIIGLDVFTTAGECLGRVTEILQTGSNDVYVVRPTEKGQKDLLLPALKSVVKKVDLQAGRMEVDLPRGLR